VIGRLVALALFVAACGARETEPSRTPALPSATPAAAPAGSTDELWERCHLAIERRCTVTNPEGGAAAQHCRDKFKDRYLRIKTPEARREYMLGLGCRPSTVD
jgi:hypothetical protein